MQANVRKVVQDLLSRMADQDKAQLTILLLGQPPSMRCLAMKAQSTMYRRNMTHALPCILVQWPTVC